MDFALWILVRIGVSLTGVAAILLLLAFGAKIYITKWKYNHWRRLGLPYAPAKFPQGSFQYGGGGSQHVTKTLMDYYFKFKSESPLYGTFTFFVPTLTLTSLDLTKEVLIKEFQTFHDRFSNYIVRHDHLTKNLVRLEGQEWRNLRKRLSPTFTSGQMKFMFPTILGVAEKAADLITSDCELKDVMVRYTTDTIGKCVFGLDCNSLENPFDVFTQMGQKIIRVNRPKSFLLSRFPILASLFKMTLFDQEASEFFTKVVGDTVRQRQEKDEHKKDFLDILLNEHDLSIEEITAQLVVFYTAGMDNTSSILTFAIAEMAQNLDVQRKARASVLRGLEKEGFTYEAVVGMGYLDQVVNETLRKYPPSPIVTRNANRSFPVPGVENFVIEKGTRVNIPIYSFHHDPEYFPNPEHFDPERFEDPKSVKAFFPFGDGPRSCIAARFGTLNIKVALAVLLRKYKFQMSSRTELPLEFNPSVPMLHTKHGVYIEWEECSLLE